MMHLQTRRIWFWQIRIYDRAGWFVRTSSPLSLRLTAAAFFDIGREVAEVFDGGGRGDAPFALHFLGYIFGDGQTSRRLPRALNHLAKALRPVGPLDDLPHGLVGEAVKPVDHRSRKLSINQLLQLRGIPVELPHIDPSIHKSLKARIEAWGRDSRKAAS